jgi:hypothetical protein
VNSKPCTITIEYGWYKWMAVLQENTGVFLCREYQGNQLFNSYTVRDDHELDEQIDTVLEGSV